MNKVIAVHEAANMLNDSGRCLQDFLNMHKLDCHENVSRAKVLGFIALTPECEPFTD